MNSIFEFSLFTGGNFVQRGKKSYRRSRRKRLRNPNWSDSARSRPTQGTDGTVRCVTLTLLQQLTSCWVMRSRKFFHALIATSFSVNKRVFHYFLFKVKFENVVEILKEKLQLSYTVNPLLTNRMQHM